MKISTNHQDTLVQFNATCLQTVSDTRDSNDAGMIHTRTPLIRTLIIRIANFPDQLCPSSKVVENSTKLTCLEIIGDRIKYKYKYSVTSITPTRHGQKF
jgi:hypothetical protein